MIFSMSPESERRSIEIIWLDVTDFLIYVERGATTLSGIQRVIANLLVHADLAKSCVVPFLIASNCKEIYVIDALILKSIIESLQGHRASHSHLKRLCGDARAFTAPAMVKSGDML